MVAGQGSEARVKQEVRASFASGRLDAELHSFGLRTESVLEAVGRLIQRLGIK